MHGQQNIKIVPTSCTLLAWNSNFVCRWTEMWRVEMLKWLMQRSSNRSSNSVCILEIWAVKFVKKWVISFFKRTELLAADVGCMLRSSLTLNTEWSCCHLWWQKFSWELAFCIECATHLMFVFWNRVLYPAMTVNFTRFLTCYIHYIWYQVSFPSRFKIPNNNKKFQKI